MKNPLPPPSHHDEAVEGAVNDLMQDGRMRTPSEGEGKSVAALLAAIQLKTASAEPKLRKEFDQKVESMLLQKFAKSPAGARTEATATLEETPDAWGTRKSWGSWLAKPAWTGAFALVLLLTVITVQPWELLVDPTPRTIAEVQSFESLSEAEVLLGQLPEGAITEDGVDVAALRQILHETNALIAQTDTTLDPTAEVYPHVELRNASFAVIKQELEVKREATPLLIAMADPQTNLSEFAQKVSTWPTTNEGVDFETHSKSVNAFLSHVESWDADMLKLAQLIVAEL